MVVYFAKKKKNTPQYTSHYKTGTLQILTLKMKLLQDYSPSDNFNSINSKINLVCHTELSIIAMVNSSFPSINNSTGPANPHEHTKRRGHGAQHQSGTDSSSGDGDSWSVTTPAINKFTSGLPMESLHTNQSTVLLVCLFCVL